MIGSRKLNPHDYLMESGFERFNKLEGSKKESKKEKKCIKLAHIPHLSKFVTES